MAWIYDEQLKIHKLGHSSTPKSSMLLKMNSAVEDELSC